MQFTKDEMKRLFRLHTEVVLGAIAVALGAVIVSFYIWGVAELTATITTAIVPSPIDGVDAHFDLDKAGKLDFRGLE